MSRAESGAEQRNRSRGVLAIRMVAVLTAAALALGLGWDRLPSRPPQRNLGVESVDGVLTPVPVGSDAEFVPGSSVLAGTHDPAELAQIAADREWLAAGSVPGRGGPYEEMARRALLDIRALLGPDGAVQAAPVTIWQYTWPRDAAFVVAALSATGHHDDAEQVLRFLADVAPTEGWWAARYRADGTPVAFDGRADQLDGAGWVPWAVWSWWVRHPDPDRARAVLADLAPMVRYSADLAAAETDEQGRVTISPDYREQELGRRTLATAAPLAAGLRAAVVLAPELDAAESSATDPRTDEPSAEQPDEQSDRERWDAARQRLDEGIARDFGTRGYPDAVGRRGLDTGVTMLAPPLGPGGPDVAAAIQRTEARLRLSQGGVRPTEFWTADVDLAWTPSTSMFALASAGTGDEATATRLLDFLDAHRTSLGSLPEKVDVAGRPVSVAPLGWTAASVLLTLVQLERGLPQPGADRTME